MNLDVILVTAVVVQALAIGYLIGKAVFMSQQIRVLEHDSGIVWRELVRLGNQIVSEVDSERSSDKVQAGQPNIEGS